MATKLDVYRQALIHLGKATIQSLTDDVPARYTFDLAWRGVVEEALNEGDWNFAKAIANLTPNYLLTPVEGWQYSYDYPADYLRTLFLANSPYAFSASWDFRDLGGHFYANVDQVYLHYISSAVIDNVEVWPTMFWRYVAMKLAFETNDRLTEGSSKSEALFQRMKKALRQAKSVDARNENNQELSRGSWLRARRGGYGYGGRGNYIGIAPGTIQFEEGDV